MASALTGNLTTKFDNANSFIGVGDSNTAFNATQTDLQAVTNKFRQGMDSTYPLVTDNQMVFKATILPADANFAWQEWGIFNAPTAGIMLDRVVEYNGTKLLGQTWIMTATVTVVIGT